MREIKFRVWSKDSKTMHYPFHNPMTCKEMLSFSVKKQPGEEEKPYWIYWHDVVNDSFDQENGILMQFTGLKDKNSKEIYEGDIVRTPEGVIASVFYAEDTCGFRVERVFYQSEMAMLRKQGYEGEFKDKKVRQPLYETEEYEIIGNIYKNPELLNDSS